MQILTADTPWEVIVELHVNPNPLNLLSVAALDVASRLEQGQYGGDINRAKASLRRRKPGFPKPIYSQVLEHVLNYK